MSSRLLTPILGRTWGVEVRLSEKLWILFERRKCKKIGNVSLVDPLARLRTLAALPVEVELRQPPTTPVYQRSAAEAAGLRGRGLRVAAIARQLGVDHHTVDKAIGWF